MLKREFLMLAHTYESGISLLDYWASEKLDGMRVFWDGGCSRALPKDQVPWSNTAKDNRLKNREIATGLWSRYGNVIHAPDFFLDRLPKMFLDGELYLGRGRFQELVSTVKKIEPNPEEWKSVTFNVFDIPVPKSIFTSGVINSPNFNKTIDFGDCLSFVGDSVFYFNTQWHLEATYRYLKTQVACNDVLRIVEQTPVNNDEEATALMLNITRQGGEGIMLRYKYDCWYPKRSNKLLKYKAQHDDEAIVRGYISGQGKLRGMLGSLIVEWCGQSFNLSGFTDYERELSSSSRDWAWKNPNMILPIEMGSNIFPRGSLVTFLYRELTTYGVPKEARYFRKRE